MNRIILLRLQLETAIERRDIHLHNGNRYAYTTLMYNVENTLDIVKATLKQFTVYDTNNKEDVVCKLYETDKGNWYDLTENNAVNSFLLTSIKIAIDEAEQQNLLLQKHG